MAKTFKDFVTEATYRTRTGNTLSTVSGGKPNLPNPNAVPGARAAPGTKPIPITTTSKVKNLVSTIAGTKPGGWQEKPAAKLKQMGNYVDYVLNHKFKGALGKTLTGVAVATSAATSSLEGRREGQTVKQALGRGVVGGYGTWAGMARGAALGAKLGRLGYAAGPLVGTITTGAGTLAGAYAGSEAGNKLLTKPYDTGIKIKQQIKQQGGFQKAIAEPVANAAKQITSTSLLDQLKKGAAAPRWSKTYQSSSGQGN